MNTQECWECTNTVNLNKDKYYFFDVTEEVLCWECCKKEGIDENGDKVKTP